MMTSTTIRQENSLHSRVSTSLLEGKLVLSNAFDSKETPTQGVWVMPSNRVEGTTPQVAVKVVLAAIGAAITLGRPFVHLARV